MVIENISYANSLFTFKNKKKSLSLSFHHLFFKQSFKKYVHKKERTFHDKKSSPLNLLKTSFLKNHQQENPSDENPIPLYK